MKANFSLDLQALEQFPRDDSADEPGSDADLEPRDIAFLRAVAARINALPGEASFSVRDVNVFVGAEGPFISSTAYPDELPDCLSERIVGKITLTSKFRTSITNPGKFVRRRANATLDKYYVGDNDTIGWYELTVTGTRLRAVKRLHGDVLAPSRKAEKCRVEEWVK